MIRWKDTPSQTMIVRSAPRVSWGTILETWNAWQALSASNWSLLCNNSNFRLIGPANMFKKHSNAPKISSVKNFSSPLHNVQHASESQTNKSLCNNPTSHLNPFIPAKKISPISSPLRNIQRASESQQAPSERPQLFSKGLWRQIDVSRIGDCLCSQL